MRVASLFAGATTGLLTLATAATACAAATPADTRTPEAIGVQVALERVCLPLLKGQALERVAGSSGLKSDDQGWYLVLPRAERLSLLPPGGANPTVCSFTVTFPVDHPQPILTLLNVWAEDHGLTARRKGQPSTGPAEQRWTWSWEGNGPSGSTAIVFDTEKTLQGRPVSGELDRATVLVSQTRPA